MEPSIEQYVKRTGNNLESFAPGHYVDDSGAEFFYLTGMYVCIAQRVVENPGLYTHAFVVEVLSKLRSDLHLYRLELMD